MDKPLPLSSAAEQEILRKMIAETPDDVLRARPRATPRQIRGVSLREIGCDPVAFVEREPIGAVGATHTDQIYGGVMTVMNRLEDVTKEATRLASDKLLSQEGRANKLTGAWEPVRAALNQLEDILTAEASQIESMEAEVFAVPALEPTNVVDALLDVERRRWFNELDPDTRLRYAREMYEGKHADLAAALARSPIPDLKRDFATAAWRAAVERKHPQRVQGLATRRDRLEWARSAARAVNGAVTEWHQKNRQMARAA